MYLRLHWYKGETNMKMPDNEYNSMMRLIKEWTGTKEQLQKMYDEIYYKYDDGAEMLRRLDKYQSKWTMNLH